MIGSKKRTKRAMLRQAYGTTVLVLTSKAPIATFEGIWLGPTLSTNGSALTVDTLGTLR